MSVVRNNSFGGLVSAFLVIGGLTVISNNHNPDPSAEPGYAERTGEGAAMAGGIGLIASAIRARMSRRLEM